MGSLDDLLDMMHEPSVADVEIVSKAYKYAEKLHEDHLRLSGEPFFVHVYATAAYLAGIGMGAQTVAAGLLHDSLEDANVEAEDIEREFGSEILFLVQGVTKLKKVKYRGEVRHVESLRKFLMACSKDIRVLIIKFSDRLHNMKTLRYQKKEKQKQIALETLEIYAPLAYRLGMRKLNRELENLSFPYVYPKEHKKIRNLLKTKAKDNIENLNKFHKTLKKTLAKNGITDLKSDTRMKGLYSLYHKLKKRDGDIDKIYDILALRIIVPELSDCYKVLGIIHGTWRPLPGRIKDYIAFPKPNGYRSLHTTIFTGTGGIVEIQIRSERMHKEAEFGIASHLSYKEGDNTNKLNQNLQWITQLLPKKFLRKGSDMKSLSAKDVPGWARQMTEYLSEFFPTKELMKNLKTDVFEQRVFVFTPKGDVVDLPIDSSPIDFAYAIHTDIGTHASGATVNGKFVSLNTPLKNGDIVKVETRKSSHPTNKWLDIVKTNIARKRIQAYLKGES